MKIQISDKEQNRIKSATEYDTQQGCTVTTENLEIGDYIFSNNEDNVVFLFLHIII